MHKVLYSVYGPVCKQVLVELGYSLVDIWYQLIIGTLHCMGPV